MKYVRIECIDVKNRDDPWHPLFIDLVLDDENIIQKEGPICGWWGKVRSTDLAPFVAKIGQDGVYEIDFGSDEDTNQHSRHRPFHIPDTPLKVASDVSFEYGTSLVTLKVKTITDMLAKKLLD